ncbi:DUF4180 domain-containing protein [Chitinophaga solisilvae]|uniref:DUF4180 domain-containing protein n=1 Tax=Chitinophaga solisilvae TaxID=1233460 RepID=UPI00136E31FD|nr:DUF4180 domain-containing protein [Chitinophaga solisilvae]
MEIITHQNGNNRIAEVTSGKILIRQADDALQLFMDLYYQDFNGIILHEHNITPEFFDLKTGLAGEVLQKCSTYQVRLAIVGDFSGYPGKSLRDFIYESNKGRLVNFLDTVEAAVSKAR